MMKKVLITGISGFAGSHLADYLLSQKQYEISGTYLGNLQNIQHIQNQLNLIQLDLTDTQGTSRVITDIRPDIIFHLAALSAPGESFKNPAKTIENNVTAQVNLLDAVRDNNLQNTKILIVSSAEVYGMIQQKDLPIDEETPFMPTNPYAVSKITQDFLGLQYFLSYNIKTIRVRPFNHIGPRQAPNFVVAAFASKIAEIEKGKREPVLTVGNLQTKRDFTDVRDMVKAYSLAIEYGQNGEVYNIGSEKSYKIENIVQKLISLSSTSITLKTDESLLRPSDVPELLCDATKFRSITGWQPSIPIETTLKDTLDYWRSVL